MQPLRQGDVLLTPATGLNPLKPWQQLPHLVLAEGEVTGHRHRISEGTAELYKRKDRLYLKVLSETATLTHEEHQPIQIPQGTWMVRTQREYQPQGWRYVSD